jgi:23S rRNA (cytidine1920-2'-O)/16S rRNA (cytidine1409-2'-O)-methyltransferase
VGEGGVVRDPQVHQEVCAHARAWLAAMPGWRFQALETSPVVGPMGNIEFLMLGTKDDDD